MRKLPPCEHFRKLFAVLCDTGISWDCIDPYTSTVFFCYPCAIAWDSANALDETEAGPCEPRGEWN